MLETGDQGTPELVLLRRRLAILEEQRLLQERALYRAELQIWHYEDLLRLLFEVMDLPFVPYDPTLSREDRAAEAALAAPPRLTAP